MLYEVCNLVIFDISILERHRKFIQPSAICRQKARRPDNDGSELDCCWDAFDRELWVKLDRLQVQEEQGREMERYCKLVRVLIRLTDGR